MNSMTGFASRTANCVLNETRIEWEWDLRAVNGRGLEIRMRIPEGYGFIEKKLKDKVAARVARGSVTLGLRLRVIQAGGAALVDRAALETLLGALRGIEQTARAGGVVLQAPTALDVLGWRGIQASGHDLATFETESLGEIVAEDFDLLLADFCAMRAQEGEALGLILASHVAEMERLVRAARALQASRADALRAHFQKTLAQVLDATRTDPARMEQELALLAVKADIAEELDRLEAHCAAAHALLRIQAPIGRKLDFLTQEFNREANTLCSKAQHLEMTRIGLDLKAVIDQMREQVQNVE
ncbi:MAG: YicC family protein [Roseinatronobacter sp.]|jgi:uncharacterized protein (TIGR00255 family)|nr:YicC family protein [Roseinatronobacter sp.]